MACVRRQHPDNLIEVLIFIGLSMWALRLTRFVGHPMPDVLRVIACFAAALLGGQIVRNVWPSVRLARIAICAFVAHCLVFGLQEQLGWATRSYQVPVAIAATEVAAVLGAMITQSRSRAHPVWLVLALGAVELGVFEVLISIVVVLGLPAGTPTLLIPCVGVVGGALLFVTFISDLENWQLGVAGAWSVGFVFFSVQRAADWNDLQWVLFPIALSMIGGLFGRKLRSRLKKPSELPVAQARK